MNEAKRIITEQCQVRHISTNDLARRIQLSTATLEKRLEEPDSFRVCDINRICVVLRLNDEERAVLMGNDSYEKCKRILGE